MGNKKKHVNADPTMSMIRNIFQENLQLVNRVQRKSRSDIVTKYDLTEKLCTRRMKAVAHLMPEMQERYAKTYPEIDIKSEFADIASLPVLSYDIIDEESYLCLGAAIWMLDQIWEEHERKNVIMWTYRMSMMHGSPMRSSKECSGLSRIGMAKRTVMSFHQMFFLRKMILFSIRFSI